MYIICSQRNCRKPSKLGWFYVYGFSFKQICNNRWAKVRWAKVRWAKLRWANVRWANVRWAKVRAPNILRRLLRRPRYCSASGLFAECGILNGKAVIRNLIYKFITRLNESTNDGILAILSSDIRWTSRIRHYWVKTLYVHPDLV